MVVSCPECETIHFTDKVVYCQECGYKFPDIDYDDPERQAAFDKVLFKN